MTVRVLRPAITLVTVSAVLLAALAVYLLFTGASTTDAEGGHYDATNTQTLTSLTPGAARGSTTVLSLPGTIGVSGDQNFASNITFDPASVVMTPNCNIAGGRDRNADGDALDAGETTTCLVAGTTAGQQNSDVALGLLNGRCNAPLTVVHDLFVIPTPNNEVDPRASTNIVYPRPEGSNNRYHGWQIGSEPAPAGGTAPDDVDANTRYEGTAGTLMAHNYPDYLLDLFDPDGIAGPLDPAVPEQVFGGMSSVANTDVPLIFVIFPAGALNTAFAGDMPHPFARMTAAMGHPSTAVLNDPTALQASPSTITDFCDPLTATNTLNATVGGVTRATNPPAAGTAIGLNYTASLRDTDNDGYENAFDTCPKNANVDNGRATAGADQDAGGTTVGDMLDPACDPSPTGLSSQNADQDADLFPNAQDNCPLVANPTQIDSEVAVAYASGGMDGGPLTDTIGDDCDTGSITVTLNNKSTTYTFSSLVGNGHFHAAARPLPQCYNTGGVPADADGDGYCAGTTDGADSGSCTTAVPPNCSIRHQAWTGAGAVSVLMEYDTDRAGGDITTTADTGNAAPVSFAPVVTLTVAVTTTTEEEFTVSSTTPIAAVMVNGVAAVQIDLEVVCVVRITTVTTMTVVRHCAGTSAATHTATTEVKKSTVSCFARFSCYPIIACPGGAGDLCPENGFDSDFLETYVGSNPAQACAQDTTSNNEPYDSWAYDINDDTRANLSDVTGMGPSFGKFNNAAGGNIRTDLNSDGITNLSDVTGFGPFFGKQCRRVDGTFGTPQ